MLYYDSRFNLIKAAAPDGGVNRWTYDGLGQCLKHENAKGGITEYEYDLLGQVTRVSEPDGYSVWKSALMLKAALLASRKKRREAIVLYERLAEEATNRYDIFYIMEAYRMAGYFYYELGETNTSLETLLLSLYGGSFLDRETRRHSSFLLSAALALHLANNSRSSYEVGILENSLEEWLGKDWRNLVETEDMKKVKSRRKASIFS